MNETQTDIICYENSMQPQNTHIKNRSVIKLKKDEMK